MDDFKANGVSYVTYEGSRMISTCPYAGCDCTAPSYTNYKHAMRSTNLSVDDYQELIDRGWRRLGYDLRKPVMAETCCPEYPIRCPVNDFVLTKSQKKVIRKVNRFLSNGRRGEKCDDESDSPDRRQIVNQLNHVTESIREILGCDVIDQLADDTDRIRLSDASQDGSTKSTQATNRARRTLEDHLYDVSANPAHKLELKLVRSSPPSEEFESYFDACLELFGKFQMAVFNDDPTSISKRRYQRFFVESPLFERLPTAQQQDHERAGRPADGYGTFHQLYLLDGKLIAVGLVDVLPRSVYSVYFYYDPEYAFLSLGTYSSLREVAFTRALSRIQPSIAYYTLGLYAPTSRRMQYKSLLKPSYLCCPETYTWHPLSDCLEKLRANKYSRLAPNDVTCEPECGPEMATVYYAHRMMKYADYRRLKGSDDLEPTPFPVTANDPPFRPSNEVQLYCRWVGARCVGRMVLERRRHI